jgi:hypothetical protein
MGQNLMSAAFRLQLRQRFGDGAHPLAKEFREGTKLAVLQGPDRDRMS